MTIHNSYRPKAGAQGMVDGSFQSTALSAVATGLAATVSIVATRQGHNFEGVGVAAFMMFTSNLFIYNIQEHTRWAVNSKSTKTRRSGMLGVCLSGVFLVAAQNLMKHDAPTEAPHHPQIVMQKSAPTLKPHP